ncbi:MAG: hypothetical protein WDO19_00205 [Bacteroidota bacterium]
MISIFLVVQLRNVFKGFWILAFQRNQDLDVFKGLGIGSFKGCLDLAFQRIRIWTFSKDSGIGVSKVVWVWLFQRIWIKNGLYTSKRFFIFISFTIQRKHRLPPGKIVEDA